MEEDALERVWTRRRTAGDTHHGISNHIPG